MKIYKIEYSVYFEVSQNFKKQKLNYLNEDAVS